LCVDHLPYHPLSPFIYAFVLIAALLGVWWVLRSRTVHRPDAHGADNLDTITAWPPQATRVLTTPERQTYDLLRSALPAHMILAQVPLQRFIKVPTRNSYAEWLRRVGHLSADFVVCDRHSQVIAVVEVRASDEQLSDRAQRRQLRLERVLKAAQIPVHVWDANALPAAAAAREAIAPAAVEEDVSPAVTPSPLRSLPGMPAATKPGALAGEARPAPVDDGVGLREPPPSTWFDDFDTAPAPLSPAAAPRKPETKDRAAR
jgi:hypothetical protein